MNYFNLELHLARYSETKRVLIAHAGRRVKIYDGFDKKLIFRSSITLKPSTFNWNIDIDFHHKLFASTTNNFLNIYNYRDESKLKSLKKH